MRKAVVAVIIVLAVGVIVFSAGRQALAKYIVTDPAPEQPINFSHKKHAGDNEIPCLFCHIYATKSKVSGVPSVQRCLGCHASIRTDSPEIKKLQQHWDRQEAIPWVKVYDLPDYIYFPHKRHVKGGVKCQECHGDVANMARIRQVTHLVMGWCLECHKKRNGPIDCWECHV